MQSTLQEVLHHLVSGIVSEPEAVRVDAVTNGENCLLEVRVAAGDLGRVIGRGGRTVQALRTVIAALARGERVRIDVVDTEPDSDS